MPRALSRRTLLRGAGTAIALPMLECMLPARRTWAAGPRRFIGWYNPGGTTLEQYTPSGGETDFSLSPILQPLAPFRRHLLVFAGVDMIIKGPGHQHVRGIGSMLTGQPMLPGNFRSEGAPTSSFAAGPSLDQVLAKQIGTGTKLPSLELGIGWPSKDGSTPYNALVFAGPNMPVPPQVNPQLVFDRLFKDLPAGGDGAAVSTALEARRQRKRSVLDAVAKEYGTLSSSVGAEDRRKLEAHAEQIRNIERSLATAAPSVGIACRRPALAANAGPLAGWAALPEHGKLMMDLLVMAMVCDITRVGTLLWNEANGSLRLPFINLPEHVHGYQHESGKGLQKEVIAKIHGWFVAQIAYLCAQLEGAGLLDATTIFCGTDLQEGNSHAQTDMPYLVIGGGGALKTGRFLRYKNVSHSNLLTSLANSFGLNVPIFGHKDFCTGPLAGLA